MWRFRRRRVGHVCKQHVTSAARQVLALSAVSAWAMALGHLPADAGPCKPGFVARQAAPDDQVCVPPESRARVVGENARASVRWLAGPFGPKTCAQGLVWREAFVGDLVCVPPNIRELSAEENALDPTRREP